MFKTYLITAMRSLKKNFSFSLLNLSGLAIGIACAGLIFLWVKDELTFNDYFKNQDQLFKINNTQSYDGKTFVFNSTPGPLAESIKTSLPGIENTARSSWRLTKPFTKGDNSINEYGYFVDPSFLKMFHLQFLRGNAASALSDLKSLIITDEMAKRLFGNEEALGKEVRTDKNALFKVTAVVKSLPENTSFDFEWLAPFGNFENENTWLKGWGNNGVLTFVQTSLNADIAGINAQLHNYLLSKGPGYISKFSLYPMSRWHLYDQFDNGKEVEGTIKYVRMFSIIAWFILIIACINFMNLSTARSEKRSREVGVRKVLGAGRGSLRLQFLSESVLMAFLATFLAVLIILLSLPFFNDLVEKHLSLQITDHTNWMAFIAIALICGIIAGSYPSFYLASFNPVSVLKGVKAQEGSAGFIRKVLVVLQFSISIVLIISTMIVYRQIVHVKERDLGFEKDALVYWPLQGEMKDNFSTTRNALLQTGVVKNAGISNSAVLNYSSNTGDFSWKGKDPNKQVLITMEPVSPAYIPTVGYKILKGRNFYDAPGVDSASIIINETLATMLNTKEVIGSKIYGLDHENQMTVVGVVRDFLYNNFYSKPAPMLFYCDPSRASIAVASLNSGVPVQDAITRITSIVKKSNPGYPLDMHFVDADFNQFFKSESLIERLAYIFSALAIFISCLGLFGLSAYTAERRTREIGIRKVLGASEKNLAVLLSRNFLLLVGISCLIAFAVAWWMMNQWLQNYEYRIHISWQVFAIAGVSAMLIAVFTVSLQAIKAAMKNPVVSIKSE